MVGTHRDMLKLTKSTLNWRRHCARKDCNHYHNLLYYYVIVVQGNTTTRGSYPSRHWKVPEQIDHITTSEKPILQFTMNQSRSTNVRSQAIIIGSGQSLCRAHIKRAHLTHPNIAAIQEKTSWKFGSISYLLVRKVT